MIWSINRDNGPPGEGFPLPDLTSSLLAMAWGGGGITLPKGGTPGIALTCLCDTEVTQAHQNIRDDNLALPSDVPHVPTSLLCYVTSVKCWLLFLLLLGSASPIPHQLLATLTIKGCFLYWDVFIVCLNAVPARIGFYCYSL